MLDLLEVVANSGFLIATYVALIAGFMRGFVGVGSGMLMAPVFAILYGPVETVTMVVLMELVVTAQLLPAVRELIEWPVIVPMGIAAAVLMPAGSWLLVTMDPELMTRGIAVVVFVFVVVLMAGWRYSGRKRTPVTVAVGAVSGTLMAATSLGNPSVMLYLLSGSDSAATNRANFTGYFCITLVTLIALMVSQELMDLSAVVRAVLMLPLFVGGAWLGARYFRKASDRFYRQVALGLLLCVAIFGVLR